MAHIMKAAFTLTRHPSQDQVTIRAMIDATFSTFFLHIPRQEEETQGAPPTA